MATEMEYRRLGGSGFKVPALCLGTGTFGGSNEFFRAWGTTGVEEATRLVDICLEAGLNFFDSADIYSDGQAEEVLGGAIKGRRDQVLISTKATFRSGEGPNDVGSSRWHLIRVSRRKPAPPRHRLHRPISTPWLRRAHPDRRGARHARRSRARRQDPLPRLLEFLGLASDEVSCDLREERPRTAMWRIRPTTRSSGENSNGS